MRTLILSGLALLTIAGCEQEEAPPDAPSCGGSLSIDGQNHTFGMVVVGETATMRLAGPDAALFAVEGCGEPVGAASMCWLDVTFSPTSAGTKNATLHVNHTSSSMLTGDAIDDPTP